MEKSLIGTVTLSRKKMKSGFSLPLGYVLNTSGSIIGLFVECTRIYRKKLSMLRLRLMSSDLSWHQTLYLSPGDIQTVYQMGYGLQFHLSVSMRSLEIYLVPNLHMYGGM